MLNLLRLPASLDFHSNITTLLTDLGATYQEVVKAYPKPDELRKYKQKRLHEAVTQVEVPSKKPRLEVSAEDADVEMEVVEEKKAPVVVDTGVDVNERFIVERLTPEIAAQLVMLSMVSLSFHSDFKKILGDLQFFFDFSRNCQILCRLTSARHTPRSQLLGRKGKSGTLQD